MRLNRQRGATALRGTAFFGDAMKLCGTQESAICACGHLTQSVQNVVVDCVIMIHMAPDGVAGLRRLDAATRTWLKELNIDI